MHFNFAVARVLDLDHVRCRNSGVVVKAFRRHPFVFLVVFPLHVPAHVHVERLGEVVSAVLLNLVSDSGEFVVGLMVEGRVPMLRLVSHTQEISISFLAFLIEGDRVCEALCKVLLSAISALL